MVDRDQVYKEELDQRDLSIADLDGRSHHFAMILGRQCLQIRHQAKVSQGRKYTTSDRYVREKFVPYPELVSLYSLSKPSIDLDHTKISINEGCNDF